MDITSIDNMYEEDGIVLLHNFLIGLNAEQQADPHDPLRRQLIAILPEYDDAGVLQRLDVLTCPATDPGLLDDAEIALMDAAAAIVAKRAAAHAAAIKELEAHPIRVSTTPNGTPPRSVAVGTPSSDGSGEVTRAKPSSSLAEKD